MTTVTRESTSVLETARTRDAWEGIATGYDRFVTPTHFWLGGEALRRAGLRAGERFLDVAAGSGALSIPAARLGARVLATDLSPAMIERLLARARDEGLAGVEGRAMDGHQLALDDDTFDLAGSQFGVMLFPDLPRALREMRRVVRPGGRVLLVVYGPPSEVEFLGFFVGAIQAVVPGFTGLPADPPPLPFQVADPAKLRRALADAGLRNVTVETITETLEFPSGEAMWSWLVNSNPIAETLVADATEAQRAEIRRVLGGMLRERAGGSDAARLTNPIHVAIGEK